MKKRTIIIGGILTFLLLFSTALPMKVKNLPRIKLPSGKDDNKVSNVKAIYVGPGGELYIGSARNNRVQVFSSNGQFLRSIPSIKGDDIEVPHDIDIGIDGSIYIVDRDRKELSKFGEDGVRLGTLGGKKAFKKPMSVSVSREGTVYVADYDAKNVRILDPAGQFVGMLQGSGFEQPIAVDVDHQGRIFVLDKKKKTVQVFERDGTLWGEVPVAYGGQEAKEPIDMCVNQHGEIFVLDGGERVVYFTDNFEARTWSPPFGGGMFDKPLSIDVAGRDECFVMDNGNETVWKFKLTELPSLVKEKTVVESASIINKAVIANNIDSIANIRVNYVNPKENKIVLSVFENNRNIVSGLIAENFLQANVKGQEVKILSAGPQMKDDKIDFIFLIGTEDLKANEIKEIQSKIVSEFLSKLDESKNRVAAFTFAENVKLVMPLEKSFSKQKSVFSKLEFNGQKAPIFDALLEGIQYYDTVASKTYPIFVLITNSEGKSSRNNFRTLEDFKASNSLPQIYTLGFDNKKSEEMLSGLKKIADLSGGFFYSSDQRDMIYFLFRRSIALIRGQYSLNSDQLPNEGELAISVDVDMDGNLITSSYAYTEPSGEKVTIKGEGFFEKYWLIILIVVVAIIILIIIIAAVKAAKARSKAPLGEALLEVKSGDAPQKSYNMRKGANRIGAAKDADISLGVEGVSREHAVIEYSGGKYELVDKGSTNGTFVNKNRITRRLLINDDIISIGSVDFIFKTG